MLLTRRLFLILASSVLVAGFAGCSSDQPDGPAPTSISAAAPTSQVAAQETPTATVTPPWELPRGDGAIGVLSADWGPRAGWDAGSPGAGRAALLPLALETGEELPGYEPFDLGHFFGSALSPDGSLLA